jgi:excisionase family DNA binding protein
VINTLFKASHVYECPNCETVISISKGDDTFPCPNCGHACNYTTDGVLIFSKEYRLDDHVGNDRRKSENNSIKNEQSKYPTTLTAKHIAEILNISRRKAYEVMESNDFPLIRIGRHKKVSRKAFFEWLDRQA